jgi:hypothetical protein
MRGDACVSFSLREKAAEGRMREEDRLVLKLPSRVVSLPSSVAARHFLPEGEGNISSARKMLDRRHRAEAVGQALEQGQAVGADRGIVDVHHHAVEERIHLRA